MAAPIHSGRRAYGFQNIIIVVFAVVVIGGMGSILGAIVTRLRAWAWSKASPRCSIPQASSDSDLRHHGDRAARSSRPACSGGPPDVGHGRRRRTPRRAGIPRRGGGAGDPRDPCAPSQHLHRPRGPTRDRAVRALPRFRDEGVVLRAVRLRLQPPPRLWRPPVVRPRRLFRHGELRLRLRREGVGIVAAPGDPGRHRGGCLAGSRLRGLGDPAPGHLLRHDHAGARPDGVFLLAAGEVHRGRGRHSGGAARPSLRDHRSRPTT